MTMPQEHVERMLSGYLDDALAADEHAEVRRWIEQDPSMATQLSDLRDLRDSLRMIAAEDREIKLDAGFSGRVMEAAVARARSEGLAEDHPLVRVSEHPTSIRPVGRPRSWRQSIGIAAAIAASAAVFLLGRNPSDSGGTAEAPTHNEIATSNSLENQTLAPESVEAESPAKLALDPNKLIPNKIDKLAKSDSQPSVNQPSAETARPDMNVAVEKNAAIEKNTVQPHSAKVALLPREASDAMTASADRPAVVSGLAAILVLDVRLTDNGRATGAVRRAMRTAAIDQAGEKAVGADMFGAAKNAAQVGTVDRVSMLYLQAPAKNLDRFYLRLLADDEGVQSVGMTIASNAPVMKIVNSIQTDPTSVRHNGMMMLPGDPETTKKLVNQLGGLEFLPLDAALVNGVANDSGPDIESQVLVLVR